MPNIWHEISPRRISKEKFMAVIEIPKGCKNKYEMDKDTGLLRLDRVLSTVLSPVPMPRTMTLLMCWCSVRKL